MRYLAKTLMGAILPPPPPSPNRVKFDLKSSYHHISIYAPHLTHSGFSWVINGETKYFAFTVLPFGLSTSPYISTKVVRPPVKYWRFKGNPVVGFIDDGIGMGKTKKLFQKNFFQNLLKIHSINLVSFLMSRKLSWNQT